MPSSPPTEPLRKTPGKFTIHEEDASPEHSPQSSTASVTLKRIYPASRYDTPSAVALVTSKMSNLTYLSTPSSEPEASCIKKIKMNNSSSTCGDDVVSRTDKLLSSLAGTDMIASVKATHTAKSDNVVSTESAAGSFSKSMNEDVVPPTIDKGIAPQTEVDQGLSKQESGKGPRGIFDQKESEVEKLKKQLAAAQGRIAAMDMELSQQRITKDSLDSILRSPSEAHFSLSDADKNNRQFSYQDHSSGTHTNLSGTISPHSAEGPHGSWDDGRTGPFPHLNAAFGAPNNVSTRTGWNAPMPPAWTNFNNRPNVSVPPQTYPLEPQPHRPASLRLESFENNNVYQVQGMNQGLDGTHRRNAPPIRRPDSAASFYNGFSFPGPSVHQISPPTTPMPFHGMMPPVSMPYAQRPIGTPLSPTASEFSTRPSSTINSFSMNQFNGPNTASDSTSTYVAPSEPMNYRRLLDKNLSCDWKYIVDKIVCSNDQQASIFLQQKLKNAPVDQKYEMIESIIAHSYPLMINRFGNFLIQRCLEHGTDEQIEAIAAAIQGNVLNLSMDAFGCHVIQKALDVVPESIKVSMVNELLHRIPDTVIHRYACHVWQKLFELRWTGSPPQIMKRVNESLRGMWHEVALGETGSLVVQNIFENCLEEDKRPCINEVIASIDIVAHGQFGNWCIQHICEHGLPADKSRAIEHVLRFASEYSTDQFASKVVEKCLKVGGPEFMDRYLERVCEGRPGRPRMPLIDIAGDQYGNYLIQFILIHAGPQHRELVSNHVRKHMVSLRGSKFGSRVAMLCSNPAFSTRPGPPVGVQMGNGRFMHNPPMGPGGGRPPFGPASYR